jgi:hypothetical protein
MFKSLLYRFLRGGVSGAVAVMVLIVPTVNSWEQLGTWLSVLGVAGSVGFITGLLVAVDKYFRTDWE